jgi:uncharacterized membrane protein
MKTGRMEAFSDGVIAILITIMVLELKVPHGTDLQALRPVLPVLLSYILSFAYLGIYWNNHHHTLQITGRVNGAVLWANLHLLFWLSLIPFTTAWLGESWLEENRLASAPTALYGVVLLCSGLAYTILQSAIIRGEGCESELRAAVGRDLRGKVSIAGYALGVGAAFLMPLVSIAMYIGIAILWLLPDRRIESRVR